MGNESRRPARGRPGVIGAAWGLPGGGTVLAFDSKRALTQLYCTTNAAPCQNQTFTITEGGDDPTTTL